MSNPYPYDKDGYCVYCRIGQYKPHREDCDYRISVAKATKQRHHDGLINDVTRDVGVVKKVEAF